MAKITVDDIIQGKFNVPYLQPRTWIALQKKDNILSKLAKLIESGQKPEVKKTGGDNTTLKLLYGQYTKGNLKIANNGLIPVKSNDESGIPRNQVVVPPKLFPGLISALHHKLQHPTKYQMGKLVGRYFYCPRAAAHIDECVDNCHTCFSIKPLPPTIFSETTTQPDVFGTRFSVDIMKRNGQVILFMVELLTHFCWIRVLENEKAEVIKDAVLDTLVPYMHQHGATVRCDGAPSFQSLNKRAETSSDVLTEFNVVFELGQSLHTNKNPDAECIIKEGHAAINRIDNPFKLGSEEVARIMRQINFKIRDSGFSSWELLCRRSLSNGEIINKSDSDLADSKLAKKLSSHNPPAAPSTPVEAGDLVMINGSKTKLKPRDTHIVQDVVDINGSSWAEMYKMGDKMTNRPHLVKTEDLTVLPGKRKAAIKARQAIKSLVNCTVASEKHPTHAWDYEKWFQEWDGDDDEWCEEDDEVDGPAQKLGKQKEVELDPAKPLNDGMDNMSVPVRDMMEVDTSLTSKLDNPSIQIYPQHPHQVALGSVQDLSTVFQEIYNQHEASPRSSRRLASKPRTNFYRFHNFGDRRGDEEEK